MSITNYQIHFDNQYAIFYSGQEVMGRLTFDLSQEKRMRGVEIRFQGEARVWWTESRSTTDSQGNSTTVTDSYSNREKYFDNSIYVVGGPGDDFKLPPGHHSYPFRFILPSHIPSSFEGAHGHVRYVVKGIINRPWRFDHNCKRAFTVLCPLDLNQEYDIKEPFQAMKEKVLCCGCCSSDAITTVVNLPFRGFVPGQQTNAVVEVDNPTTESVTIQCNLVQKITFRASCGNTNHSETCVVKETLATVPSRGSTTQRSQLKIPSVPVSFLRHCNCIEINYYFQVRGVLSGMHRDSVLDVPVTIGTIPLATQFPLILAPEPVQPTAPPLTYPGPPEGPSDGNGDIPSSPPPYPYQQYPDMPPPTYEECMTGRINIRSKDDDEFVQGHLEFAPRYPIYNFK